MVGQMKAYWAIVVVFGILLLGTIALFSISTVVAQENNGTEISESASTSDTLSSETPYKITISDGISISDSLKHDYGN